MTISVFGVLFFISSFHPANAQSEIDEFWGSYRFIYDSTYIWPDGKGGYEYSRKFISRVELADEGRSVFSRTATPIIDKNDEIEFDAYTILSSGERYDVNLEDIVSQNISEDSRRIFINFRHAEPGAILHFEWDLKSMNASISGKRFLGRTIPVDSAIVVMTFPEPWVFNFKISPEIVLREERSIENIKESIYPISYKWTAVGIEALREEEFSPPHEWIIPGLYYSFYLDKSMSGDSKTKIDWDFISRLYKLKLDKFLRPEESIDTIVDSLKESGDNFQEHAIAAFDWVKRNFRSKDSDITLGDGLDKAVELGRGTQAEASALFYALTKKLDIQSGAYLVSTRYSRDPIPELPALFWFDRLLVACFIGKDTLWADPYYTVSDLGILPFEDQGVSILRIDSEEGGLGSTPDIDYHENGKAIHLKLNLDSLGVLSGEATEVYSGAMIPEISTFLFALGEDKRKDAWERKLAKSLPDVKFDRFVMAPPDSFGKPFIINYMFSAGPIIRPFVKRAYIPLDLLGRWEDLPNLPMGNRYFPVSFPRPRFEFERITFNISSQFEVEYIPQNYSLNSHIGEIYSVVRKGNNSITVTRGFGLKKQVYSVSAYKSIMKFFNTARSEAGKQIIIRRVD